MENETYVSAELTLCWALLAGCVMATYFIQKHHVHVLPPSGAAMLLGMVFGGLVKLLVPGTLDGYRFDASTFFFGILPPIVFSAGFNLKHKDFFKNFAAILLFAVAGTLVSTLVCGLGTFALMEAGVVRRSSFGASPFLDCLLYGALISAIDPVATLAVFEDLAVPPLLYNLVFGESVMNDAVSIVLFRTLRSFDHASFGSHKLAHVLLKFLVTSAGSTLVGVASSLATAWVLKNLPLMAEGNVASSHFDKVIFECSVMVMGAYFAYLLAEACELSGIMSLFFAGILHAHYAYHNVSDISAVVVKKGFDTIAFICETFLFAYLGLQVATFGHKVDAGLLAAALPLCLVARALNVFPLAKLANLQRRKKIPRNVQVMQWACGLRGGIAYALAVNVPNTAGDHTDKGHADYDNNPVIETATLAVVVLSTLLFGGLTGPLLRYLDLQDHAAPPPGGDREAGRGGGPDAEDPEGDDQDGDVAYSKGVLLFKTFDTQVLQPFFGGEGRGGGGPSLLWEGDKGVKRR